MFSELVKSEDWNRRADGTKEPSRTLETDRRQEIRGDPIPIPPLPFEGARIQRERRITEQDIDEFGATVGCSGCNGIKDNNLAQAHSDRRIVRLEECLRTTPQGAESLDIEGVRRHWQGREAAALQHQHQHRN